MAASGTGATEPPSASPGALCFNILEQVEQELQGASEQASAEPLSALDLTWIEGGGERRFTPADSSWLRDARRWLHALRPKAVVPDLWRLPAQAVQTWEPPAAVLFSLTSGRFDPARHAPNVGARRPGGRVGLVSVVCTTTSRNSPFHPLLYKCFATQTHEPRELVVVHAGDSPSPFFQDCAKQDGRVIYRFFPTQEKPQSTESVVDDDTGNPFAAIMCKDDPAELLHVDRGSPWEYEMHRDGWTRGMLHNIACCISQGAAIAHFDDGCLYAPNYIGHMLSKLHAHAARVPGSLDAAAAVALAQFHTVALSRQIFRTVDLRQRDPIQERMGCEDDRYNHGFTCMYSRTSWERMPFPDMETAGTEDSSFLHALRNGGADVAFVEPPLGGIAAHGWHRDATCGTRDAAGSINNALVGGVLRCRGVPAPSAPEVYKELLPTVQALDSQLSSRRDGWLRELVSEHGPLYVCARCDFGIAREADLTGTTKQMQEWVWLEADATGGTRIVMSADIGEFSCAGGAVAEGHASSSLDNINAWLRELVYRRALCRRCGALLGWRYERPGTITACASPGCQFQVSSRGWVLRPEHRDFCCVACAEGGRACHGERCERRECPRPTGPISWGLAWRHLRRRDAAEVEPARPWAPGDPPRHAETELNEGRSDACPQGHRLGLFCAAPICGALACDVCDSVARAGDHLWGCGTCDYDVCEACKAERSKRLALGRGGGGGCPAGHALQPCRVEPPESRFICDVCDQPARVGDRLWRCTTCNFDKCAMCKAKEGR